MNSHWFVCRYRRRILTCINYNQFIMLWWKWKVNIHRQIEANLKRFAFISRVTVANTGNRCGSSRIYLIPRCNSLWGSCSHSTPNRRHRQAQIHGPSAFCRQTVENPYHILAHAANKSIVHPFSCDPIRKK